MFIEVQDTTLVLIISLFFPTLLAGIFLQVYCLSTLLTAASALQNTTSLRHCLFSGPNKVAMFIGTISSCPSEQLSIICSQIHSVFSVNSSIQQETFMEKKNENYEKGYLKCLHKFHFICYCTSYRTVKDREACHDIVHGVIKSQTCLNN